MARSLKTLFRQLIELLPFGRDIFLVIRKNRVSISYRGKFDNYQMAAAASHKTAEYDIINKTKDENIDEEAKKLEADIHDYEYPLMFWLNNLLADNKSLLELGGSIGHLYYKSKQYALHPEGISWTIAELPAAVTLGTKIASSKGITNLTFFNSDEFATAKSADIFVTAGTIQYMQPTLWELLSSLEHMPNHVLINYLPAHRTLSYWTLQNLRLCEVPYRVYSARELEEKMTSLGFNLVDSWESPRRLDIPFHEDLTIESYKGYYFRQR